MTLYRRKQQRATMNYHAQNVILGHLMNAVLLVAFLPFIVALAIAPVLKGLLSP
jgi:hypothetical protein